MRFYLLLLFSLYSFNEINAQVGFASPPVVAGVSQQLALARKKGLSAIHYKLQLTIPLTPTDPIAAVETIDVDIAEISGPLQIDFKEQADHLHLITVNGKETPVVLQAEHVIIEEQLLIKGKNVVAIAFTAGNLSLNRNEEFLYTLLVPDRARTVFPCFDQPDLKATFTLSLSIPLQWQALSNAPLTDSSFTANYKLLNYATSDTISTYLFSFVAGAFNRISKREEGREMNFYHRETDTSKLNYSTDSIFRIHGNALRFLQQYTQIPFPFKKFDFVAIPDFQYGGMEHVGAINYRAASLFLDSGATRDQENARANLIAHETAHMWFGDLVTMQWFNDVWMKEVFANFIADKVGEASQVNSNYELKFLLNHFPAAYAVDRTKGANPIRQQLKNLQDAGNLYGNIIYHKAPVMMRQLERLMGKDPFRNGLREYLQHYRNQNASWADLITILKRHTSEDLDTWNKVWVNRPGRPVIGYNLHQENGRITELTLTQSGENSDLYMLPQFFEITLVYHDGIEEYSVYLDKEHLDVKQLEGKRIPACILFNSSGQGYGLFPVDKKLHLFLPGLRSPVMRAAGYISLYENMLSGKGMTPAALLAFYQGVLSKEPEELNLRLITGYISEIYWRFVSPSARGPIASTLEKKIWETMQLEQVANKKKILFKTFQGVALTKTAKDTLYSTWHYQRPPEGVKLTEEDYTSLALALAVRDYRAGDLLQQQLTRIKNVDRRNRLQFLMPAVSGDVKVRDAFFASMKNAKNREKEAWVLTALEYLHHPLRVKDSEKYLPLSLDLLQEIQATGDIFFPAAWLQSTFGSYQGSDAANVVRGFLRGHPRYNERLKAKILQATDLLFRSEKLVQMK